MSVNISVVCFKSKTLSNGEHPLFVKVSEGKKRATKSLGLSISCLLYTSDAADEEDSVDLGGLRFLKKQKKEKQKKKEEDKQIKKE